MAMSKEMREVWSNVLYKLISGRLILTVVGALSFYILVKTLCELLIQHSADFKIADIVVILNTILLVISNVFTFYFLKGSLRPPEQSNNNQPPVEENGNGG